MRSMERQRNANAGEQSGFAYRVLGVLVAALLS